MGVLEVAGATRRWETGRTKTLRCVLGEPCLIQNLDYSEEIWDFTGSTIFRRTSVGGSMVGGSMSESTVEAEERNLNKAFARDAILFGRVTILRECSDSLSSSAYEKSVAYGAPVLDMGQIISQMTTNNLNKFLFDPGYSLCWGSSDDLFLLSIAVIELVDK